MTIIHGGVMGLVLTLALIGPLVSDRHTRPTKATCEAEQTVSMSCYALRCGGHQQGAPGCAALMDQLQRQQWNDAMQHRRIAPRPPGTTHD